MAKDNEDVDVKKALLALTDAQLGFANVMDLMNAAIMELTDAVKAMNDQLIKLMEKKDG